MSSSSSSSCQRLPFLSYGGRFIRFCFPRSLIYFFPYISFLLIIVNTRRKKTCGLESRSKIVYSSKRRSERGRMWYVLSGKCALCCCITQRTAATYGINRKSSTRQKNCEKDKNAHETSCYIVHMHVLMSALCILCQAMWTISLSSSLLLSFSRKQCIVLFFFFIYFDLLFIQVGYTSLGFTNERQSFGWMYIENRADIMCRAVCCGKRASKQASLHPSQHSHRHGINSLRLNLKVETNTHKQSRGWTDGSDAKFSNHKFKESRWANTNLHWIRIPFFGKRNDNFVPFVRKTICVSNKVYFLCQSQHNEFDLSFFFRCYHSAADAVDKKKHGIPYTSYQIVRCVCRLVRIRIESNFCRRTTDIHFNRFLLVIFTCEHDIRLHSASAARRDNRFNEVSMWVGPKKVLLFVRNFCLGPASRSIAKPFLRTSIAVLCQKVEQKKKNNRGIAETIWLQSLFCEVEFQISPASSAACSIRFEFNGTAIDLQ